MKIAGRGKPPAGRSKFTLFAGIGLTNLGKPVVEERRAGNVLHESADYFALATPLPGSFVFLDTVTDRRSIITLAPRLWVRRGNEQGSN